MTLDIEAIKISIAKSKVDDRNDLSFGFDDYGDWLCGSGLVATLIAEVERLQTERTYLEQIHLTNWMVEQDDYQHPRIGDYLACSLDNPVTGAETIIYGRVDWFVSGAGSYESKFPVLIVGEERNYLGDSGENISLHQMFLEGWDFSRVTKEEWERNHGS